MGFNAGWDQTPDGTTLSHNPQTGDRIGFVYSDSRLELNDHPTVLWQAYSLESSGNFHATGMARQHDVTATKTTGQKAPNSPAAALPASVQRNLATQTRPAAVGVAPAIGAFFPSYRFSSAPEARNSPRPDLLEGAMPWRSCTPPAGP